MPLTTLLLVIILILLLVGGVGYPRYVAAPNAAVANLLWVLLAAVLVVLLLRLLGLWV
jgi:hypothetical protein